MGLNSFFKKMKRNESGETLPGLLVSSAIGGFVLIASGAFIFSALSANDNIVGNTSLSGTVSLLDTSLRNDVTNATILKARSATLLEMTVPGRTATVDGTLTANCRTTLWEIKTSADITTISRTVTTYPNQALSAAGVTVCSGTAGTAVTTVLADNVSVETKFTYANSVNHAVTVPSLDATPVFSSDPQPANTPASAWNERVLSRASLTTTIKGVKDQVQAVTISQYSVNAKNSKQNF